jgi:Rne/Rng family ribonuclease
VTAAPVPDEVLIESDPRHHRAAAIAGGRLIDVMTVPRDAAGGVGSIHLGRVVRVVAGIKAAFVEIGLEGPAFLNVGAHAPRVGATMLVQIAEAASRDKAARATARIAIEGRFVVLLPRERGVSVSRRLDKAARMRLNAVARGLVESGEGVIVRAAAAHAAKDELAAELAALRGVWTRAAAKLEAGAPACLYAEPPLRRILCAFAGPDLRYIFADPAAAREARTLARAMGGDLAERIDEAVEPGMLFDRYGVGDDLALAEGTVVPLPAGGRVTVETTAALTAVDVDSGGASTGADAALATNMAAAAEIARQLRLRETKGTVMVDFIRMNRRGDQDRVLRALGDAVAGDRIPVRVLGWTRGGLLELVRAPALDDGP